MHCEEQQKVTKCVLAIASSDSEQAPGSSWLSYGCPGRLWVECYNGCYSSKYCFRGKSAHVTTGNGGCPNRRCFKRFSVEVVKTGMLGEAKIAGIVAAKLRQYKIRKLVLDPVMVAKSGDMLLESSAQQTLQEELIPLALLITPNIPEAEVLCGHHVKTSADLKSAARIIHNRGPSYVLLKGGHAKGKEAVDILYDGEKYYYYRAPRIATKNTYVRLHICLGYRCTSCSWQNGAPGG